MVADLGRVERSVDALQAHLAAHRQHTKRAALVLGEQLLERKSCLFHIRSDQISKREQELVEALHTDTNTRTHTHTNKHTNTHI